MQQVLTSIGKAVAWYKALPGDYNDIGTLMTARQRLSCYVFELAAYCSDIHRDLISAEYVRKAFEARRFVELKDKQEKPVASHIDAVVRHEAAEYARAESEFESEYQAAKTILNAANGVLDAMAQHISLLKQEKFETR